MTIGQVSVAQVADKSPAQAAGILPGDVITHAGGREIEQGNDLVRATMLNAGSEMEWTVEREGRTEIVRLVPRVNPPEGQGATGIQISMVNLSQETRYEPPWTAVAHGFTNTWEILTLLQQEISAWISGTRAPQLSGPVGIAQVTGEVTQQGGLRGWLVLSILFSINLARPQPAAHTHAGRRAAGIRGPGVGPRRQASTTGAGGAGTPDWLHRPDWLHPGNNLPGHNPPDTGGKPAGGVGGNTPQKTNGY